MIRKDDLTRRSKALSTIGAKPDDPVRVKFANGQWSRDALLARQWIWARDGWVFDVVDCARAA